MIHSPWSEGWSSCLAAGRPWRTCRSVALGQGRWGLCPRARWRPGRTCRSRTPSWGQIRSSVEARERKSNLSEIRHATVGRDRNLTRAQSHDPEILQSRRVFLRGRACVARDFVRYWLGACSTFRGRRFSELSFGIFCECPKGCERNTTCILKAAQNGPRVGQQRAAAGYCCQITLTQKKQTRCILRLGDFRKNMRGSFDGTALHTTVNFHFELPAIKHSQWCTLLKSLTSFISFNLSWTKRTRQLHKEIVQMSP